MNELSFEEKKSMVAFCVELMKEAIKNKTAELNRELTMEELIELKDQVFNKVFGDIKE